MFSRAGRTLNDTDRLQSPTFAAYASSHPLLWNTQADHYCCTVHQRGCPSGTADTNSSSAYTNSSSAR
jgi:hypothetical protein